MPPAAAGFFPFAVADPEALSVEGFDTRHPAPVARDPRACAAGSHVLRRASRIDWQPPERLSRNSF